MDVSRTELKGGAGQQGKYRGNRHDCTAECREDDYQRFLHYQSEYSAQKAPGDDPDEMRCGCELHGEIVSEKEADSCTENKNTGIIKEGNKEDTKSPDDESDKQPADPEYLQIKSEPKTDGEPHDESPDSNQNAKNPVPEETISQTEKDHEKIE